MTSSPDPARLPLYLVLDTSVYVHCRRFDEIAWPVELGAAAVALVVPMQVLRELDKVKDLHRSKVIRERVGKVIARLHHAISSTGPAPLRQGVTVEFFHPRLTPAEFESMGLDPSAPDERILAETLALRRDRGGTPVAFLARDSAPRILAQHLGIDVRPIPVSLLLPPEPDPLERQVNDLQRQNAKLLSARPQLALTYEGGEQRLVVQLTRPTLPTDVEIRRRAKEAAKRRLSVGSMVNPPEPGSLGALLAGDAEPSEDELSRFAEALEEFPAMMRLYLTAVRAFDARVSRQVRLAVQVANTGEVPAIDVSVILEFPVGLEVEDARYAAQGPLDPPTPEHPRWAGNPFASTWPPGPYKAEFRIPHSPIAPSAIAPRIESREDGRRIVRYFLAKIQQSQTGVLDELVVTFADDDAVTPFSFAYTVAADHMEPKVGRLHTIVRWADGNSDIADTGSVDEK